MVRITSLKQMIESYINQCIEEKSSGFNTDFGIGKMTSAHVYHNLSQIVISIRSGNTKDFDFNTENAEDIINWIYNQIS